MKNRSTFLEFLRYAVVGGISAVVDIAVNSLMLFYVFSADKDDTGCVAISVAAGFLVGLAVNFVLSNLFVFRSEEQRARGKTAGAFFLYVLVGIIGFGLTELLMLIGTRFIGEHGFWYIFLTCVVKGIVLIWNYAGRKLLIYHGK